MKTVYPYEFEPSDFPNWWEVWARWRTNTNELMCFGLTQELAESVAATWPPDSDKLLGQLSERPPGATYTNYGVIILPE